MTKYAFSLLRHSLNVFRAGTARYGRGVSKPYFLTAMFDDLTIIRLIAAKNNKKNAFKIPLQFNQAQFSI